MTLVRLLHDTFRATLLAVVNTPLLFWAVLGANLVGAIVGGWFWYGPMLWESPLWSMPFVPDCPLAALLFAVALLALNYRPTSTTQRGWQVYYAFTAFACLKYGLWTVGFWVEDWSSGGPVEPVSLMLFSSHVGLFVQGLVLLPFIGRLALHWRAAIVGWFALAVFVDYGLGFHPPLGMFVSPTFAGWLAGSLTLVLGTGWLLLPGMRPQPAGYSAGAVGQEPSAEKV